MKFPVAIPVTLDMCLLSEFNGEIGVCGRDRTDEIEDLDVDTTGFLGFVLFFTFFVVQSF